MEQLPLFKIDRTHDAGANQTKPTVPPEIIIAAVELMGAIDLDPYCVDEETTLVPAKVHYGPDAKALKLSWGPKKRRVFLTPPSGRSTATWVNKLCDEYEAGNVGQAIAYLRAALDSDWWNRLMNYPICIVQRQLRAVDGKRSTPVPWAVVYLGTNIKGFAAAYKEIGTLYVPYRQPVEQQQHSRTDQRSAAQETVQYGDYVLTINMQACYIKLGHPTWDVHQQTQLRKLIVAIPGVLGQYTSISKAHDGTISLIFSFKKDQSRRVAKAVRRLIANQSL